MTTKATTRVRRAASIIGAVFVTMSLVWTARRMDLTRVFAALGHADPVWLMATALCFLAILPLWSAEWWLLSPRTPTRSARRMLGVVAMTSSVLNTAPMLAGEAAGVMLLISRTGMSRGAALSVLAMDQLFVGLAKAAVIAIALLALPAPTWLRAGVPALAMGVALLLAVLVTASRARVRDTSRRRDRWRAALRDGLRPLRSPGASATVLALALAKKAVELLAIVCVQHAFGVSLPFTVAISVLAALALATLLPMTPSNIGLYEAAIVVAYGHAGIPAELALAMGILQHALFVACLALPGYAVLATAGITRRAASS